MTVIMDQSFTSSPCDCGKVFRGYTIGQANSKLESHKQIHSKPEKTRSVKGQCTKCGREFDAYTEGQLKSIMESHEKTHRSDSDMLGIIGDGLPVGTRVDPLSLIPTAEVGPCPICLREGRGDRMVIVALNRTLPLKDAVTCDHGIHEVNYLD